MNWNKNFASIHAYLCGDGYVIVNPESQKQKYYHIGFRNTNLTLLKDFQEKFEKIFGIRPIITNQIDRCKIQNKKLTIFLLQKFGSFYSKDWVMPTMNEEEKSAWLRSYFDCDGWVSVIKSKDRKIGLESINLKGLTQIKEVLLQDFKINSSLKPHKNRNTWSITICGKDDLEKFNKKIGFLHPNKSRKLNEALDSYANYNWKIPENSKIFLKFIKEKGRTSTKRKQVRFNSILKPNLENLQNELSKFQVRSRLNGPWKNPFGTKWYCLSISLKDYNELIGGAN